MPLHVKKLIEKHNIKVFVRPSPNRIYSEHEYALAGATISDDLASCNIIFGVKEIPIKSIIERQAYCIFSHTIKGQFYNMKMLKRMLDLNCTLLDYEKVTDEHGKRLIRFGEFAGYAGMIDSLWALGQRYTWEGIDTPFQHIKQANHYHDLETAKLAVQNVGKDIQQDGLPPEICPVVCGFTGSGNVSKGAQTIFDLLSPHVVEPKNLKDLFRHGKIETHAVYKVVFQRHNRIRPKDSGVLFDAAGFSRNPGSYENNFEQFIPFLTILVNGIYWEPGQPRLITEKYLHRLFTKEKQPRLRIIGDITNDIRGSIECNHRATNSLHPVYVYDPFCNIIRDGWKGSGIVILAVDNLPTELPKEASTAFGNALLPFVPFLARADFSSPLDELKIPPEFKKAVIAHHGSLTENFKYLEAFLQQLAGNNYLSGA